MTAELTLYKDYFQCVQGTGDAVRTTASASKSISTASSSVRMSSAPSSSPGGGKCTTTFAPISAQEFVNKMNPGWNLGNTLDATETEGDWNNPPVVATTFDDIKASGYKGVRLPVTWAYHFTSSSPDWNVNATWLQRVSDVLDMITSRGFYTIVNVHHDSFLWADVTQANANITQIEERFYRLWYQIGTKLACKGSQVAFETINEPPGTTEEHGAAINRLNNIFLQAINDAGGYNAQRVVTLVGAGEDGAKTSQWFKWPDPKFQNPWAIQYHYYSPCKPLFSSAFLYLHGGATPCAWRYEVHI
jgi:endoglucanase